MTEHVERLIRDAMAAWPELTTQRHELGLLFGARTWGGKDDEAVAADMALAWACLRGHERAARTLLERFEALMVREIGRTGIGGAEFKDVCQSFMVSLLVGIDGREPKLRSYRGESQLGPWLRVCALRFALNSVRGKREHLGADVNELISAMASTNPELDYVVRHYGTELSDALGQAIAARSDEDLKLLRYHYLEGLDFAAIAAIQRVHRSTVSRRVTQVTEQLRTDIRKILQERLSVGAETLESLLTAIVSQLPLSVRRLLG